MRYSASFLLRIFTRLGTRLGKHGTRGAGDDFQILKLVGKLSLSLWELRRMLRELEVKISEIRELMFRDRYGARERNLHEMVFYEGNIDIDDIRYELE